MEEYDTFGAVLIDGDCLLNDFDDYDLNGEVMEEYNDYETNVSFE